MLCMLDVHMLLFVVCWYAVCVLSLLYGSVLRVVCCVCVVLCIQYVLSYVLSVRVVCCHTLCVCVCTCVCIMDIQSARVVYNLCCVSCVVLVVRVVCCVLSVV